MRKLISVPESTARRMRRFRGGVNWSKIVVREIERQLRALEGERTRIMPGKAWDMIWSLMTPKQRELLESDFEVYDAMATAAESVSDAFDLIDELTTKNV